MTELLWWPFSPEWRSTTFALALIAAGVVACWAVERECRRAANADLRRNMRDRYRIVVERPDVCHCAACRETS